MEYGRLRGLKIEDYQYPGEKTAFDALRKLPYLDELAALYIKVIIETQVLPLQQGDCFRITKESCPYIYNLYQTALERLDMPEEYPLYAKTQFEYNAAAYGGGRPFIIVHSSALNDMTDAEILALLGHELGHIKSEHSIYQMMARSLGQIIISLKLPLGKLIALGLDVALMDWYRAHEYTADRAGMIASGGAEASISLMAKIMGAGNSMPLVQFTEEDLLEQKTDFDEKNKDIFTRLVCLFQLAGMTHPYAISRIQALHDWEASGEYQALVEKYR